MKCTVKDHSRVQHVAMTWQELKYELRLHFSRRPKKLQLMKKFDARKWKRGEKFVDYYHDRLRLCNRLNLCEADILRTPVQFYFIWTTH